MKSTDEYVGEEIGNYRVGARVAHGSFGSVYYGHYKLLPRPVAIKVLHTIYLTSEKEQQRFLREAQLLEQLKHPHCLQPMMWVFSLSMRLVSLMMFLISSRNML